MLPNADKQVVHKPGPLKQTNKRHKGGSSKRNKNDKGKQNVKAISRKNLQLSRQERKNQLNQIRKNKRNEVLNAKRRISGLEAPPLVVTILPFDDSVDGSKFISELKSCDEQLQIHDSCLQQTHICSSRFKQRFTFLTPNKHDLHSVLDALKVSEILLLLHSSNSLDEYDENLLSVIISHALPTPIHVVQDVNKLNPKKKTDMRKQILKNLESRFPDAKLFSADTQQEMQLLLRQIGNQKQRGVGFRDKRFHLLIEDATLENINDGRGTLQVSGYVKGQPLNVNQLVHIPGWGSFQISQIDHKCDPLRMHSKKGNVEVCLTETADVLLQESLQSEIIPEPLDSEQTWPTQEELDEAELQHKNSVQRVKQGTSEYQASWILDDENEESETEEDEDEESNMDLSIKDIALDETDEIIMNDTESVQTVQDENYDNDLNMNEEKQALVRFKEERMNQMFPDEEDTPIDIDARVRYQKYRGLKNFASSPWDPMENLPQEYARIYRFQSFSHTKKKVLKSEKQGVMIGQYVTIHIKNVPQSLFDNYKAEKNTLIVFGMLPHEQKMSVINCVIRKHATCKTPIKSKDTLIFHIGYSRFTCNPIFSEHKLGNKFKFERFLPADIAVVASFYAPVIFPPSSVVVFRQQQNGSHELVATGSVLDANPNRVVVKRVVLSGHPFKIYKRLAIIKYMFFNKEDIAWFKSIELKTKCGRRGHIKDSLGTHGHMKCVFDRQLQSQDVVLMILYKRVFPKWTYDTYISDPLSIQVLQSVNKLEAMV